ASSPPGAPPISARLPPTCRPPTAALRRVAFGPNPSWPGTWCATSASRSPSWSRKASRSSLTRSTRSPSSTRRCHRWPRPKPRSRRPRGCTRAGPTTPRSWPAAPSATAGAHLVVRERLRHPRLSSAPIETRGVVAYRDRDKGTLVVSSSTQSPYTLRDVVAAALGLPVEEVRVVVPDVGGGFGAKGPIYPEEVLVATAAHRLDRPVKWVENRRENLASMGQDREQTHDVRIGFTRDGGSVAVDATFLADVGAYPLQGDGLTANTVNHLPGPYRVPHYRNVGTSVVTTKTFNAAYRAAGRPEAVFVMER